MAEESSPTPNDAKPQELSYAPDGHLIRKRNRRRKQFYITGLLALIISCIWLAPATYRRINYQIALSQCRTHEFPPNTIVVNTTKASPYWGPQLSCISSLNRTRASTTTVYVHYLTNGRKTSLVNIGAIPNSNTSSYPAPVEIQIQLLDISESSVTGISYGLRRLRGNNIKIFAGQTDPDNPAHFTIDYVADGIPGIIDGYVREFELVLEIRDPDAAVAPANIQ